MKPSNIEYINSCLCPVNQPQNHKLQPAACDVKFCCPRMLNLHKIIPYVKSRFKKRSPLSCWIKNAIIQCFKAYFCGQKVWFTTGAKNFQLVRNWATCKKCCLPLPKTIIELLHGRFRQQDEAFIMELHCSFTVQIFRDIQQLIICCF